MQRFSLLLSVRREYSLRARLLVGLFALIQFIAPTWHVCEMGGGSCCPPPAQGETLLHCPAPADSPIVSTPGGAPCCPQEAKENAPQFVLNPTPAPHGENCLAKLLLGMPWQNAASTVLLEFALRRVESTPVTPRLNAVADLPRQPSRAPPVFST